MFKKYSKYLLVFVCLNIHLIAFCQKLYSENLWTSIQVSKEYKKSKFIFDSGLRTYDDYIKQRRTIFCRILIEKKLNNNKIGVGYALFEHNKIKIENRIYFQFVKTYLIKNNHIQIRIRDDLRYMDNIFYNRYRLMGYVKYNKYENIKPYINIEYFYTRQNNFLEQRYLIGNGFEIKKNTINIFYMCQLQTGKQYIQNIIGTQINFSL